MDVTPACGCRDTLAWWAGFLSEASGAGPAQPNPWCPGAVAEPEAAYGLALVRESSAGSPFLKPRLMAR